MSSDVEEDCPKLSIVFQRISNITESVPEQFFIKVIVGNEVANTKTYTAKGSQSPSNEKFVFGFPLGSTDTGSPKLRHVQFQVYDKEDQDFCFAFVNIPVNKVQEGPTKLQPLDEDGEKCMTVELSIQISGDQPQPAPKPKPEPKTSPTTPTKPTTPSTTHSNSLNSPTSPATSLPPANASTGGESSQPQPQQQQPHQPQQTVNTTANAHLPADVTYQPPNSPPSNLTPLQTTESHPEPQVEPPQPEGPKTQEERYGGDVIMFVTSLGVNMQHKEGSRRLQFMLDAHKIDYRLIDCALPENAALWNLTKKMSGSAELPQLFVGDRLVAAGYDTLEEWNEVNEIDTRLQPPPRVDNIVMSDQIVLGAGGDWSPYFRLVLDAEAFLGNIELIPSVPNQEHLGIEFDKPTVVVRDGENVSTPLRMRARTPPYGKPGVYQLQVTTNKHKRAHNIVQKEYVSSQFIVERIKINSVSLVGPAKCVAGGGPSRALAFVLDNPPICGPIQIDLVDLEGVAYNKTYVRVQPGQIQSETFWMKAASSISPGTYSMTVQLRQVCGNENSLSQITHDVPGVVIEEGCGSPQLPGQQNRRAKWFPDSVSW